MNGLRKPFRKKNTIQKIEKKNSQNQSEITACKQEKQ